MILQPSISVDNNLLLLEDKKSHKSFLILGKNYVCYALTDQSSKKVFSIRYYYSANQVIGKSDFESIFNDMNVSRVSTFYVAIDTLKSTLFPTSMFDESFLHQYLENLCEVDQEEVIIKQNLVNEITNIFAIKKSTQNFLISKLENVEFFDSHASLLAIYQAHIILEHEASIFISCKDESFAISAYQKNDLVLHQVYEYNHVNDILYHATHLMEAKGWNINKLGIHLHGESTMTEHAFHVLQNYFPVVKYCIRISDIQYPDTLSDQPAHYFFNLFALVKCVS